MSRVPIIAGNWKMNKDIKGANELITELIPLVKGASADCVFCPPFIDLPEAMKLTKDTNIGIGAQNMHWEESGAFTGEIAGEMLKAMGVEYVIIGHSERRQYFAETDETVNKKTIKALQLGLIPITCCGETLEQRESGKAKDIVTGQIKAGLKDITDITKVVIAYEPIWAIGTGKTASNAEANEACGWVRETIGEMYGPEAADAVRIQYGGSVKPGNVVELMQEPNIDGALVGGASLTADFAKIVNFDKQ
ncbi:MAG: triose-phosphate isomerase [Eubacteriaceae bacterium]